MVRTLDRNIWIGLGLLVVFLAGMAVVTYSNTQQLKQHTDWVAHTQEVLQLVSAVLQTLVDAETGQRGFLITGQDEFLKPYHAAAQQLEERLSQLKQTTQDNPLQQQRAQKLEEVARRRLAFLQQGIVLRRQGEKQAQDFIRSGMGRAQMQQVRQLVAELEQTERELLQERERQAHRAYWIAISTGLLTAVVGLVLVCAFGWLLERSLQARHRAAADLHQEKEWFRTTLASIGDAVIATDTNGKVTFLNPVAQALTAWTDEQAQGQPLEVVFRILNETTRHTVANPALRALQEGTIVGLANHTVLLAQNSTEHPIEDSAAPIRNEHGRIVGAVLVFRDVAERRQAEKALQERIQLLALGSEIGAALVQTSSLAAMLQRCAEATVEHLQGAFARIWLYNAEQDVLELQASAGLYTHLDGPHGRIQVGQFKIGLIAQERRPHLTNTVVGDPRISDQDWARREGMVAFAGYPLLVRDKLLGVLALFARHPLAPHALNTLETVANALALGIERKQNEAELLQARAELERRVQERTSRLISAKEALEQEIAVRREAEEKANAFAVELQRSNRELEQFASVASHDLQEPLRKIQAFGDRLQAKCAEGLGDQGREYLDRMRAAATRMRTLIDDLLTFSRVTTRAQPFEPVDLTREARQVVSDLEGRLEQVAGNVEIDSLPTLNADPTQMRQLLQNLIANGLKFHRPNVPPRIRVEGRVQNRDGEPLCEITVSDNGIGFEEKYLDRIFQLFQRLHGRNEYEGTGIGLAICRKIVERHHGTITARSSPGEGATFIVTLPLSSIPEERLS